MTVSYHATQSAGEPVGRCFGNAHTVVRDPVLVTHRDCASQGKTSPDRALLACGILEEDRWCRRCGEEGSPRDTVTRRLTHWCGLHPGVSVDHSCLSRCCRLDCRRRGPAVPQRDPPRR
ncbi:hypothetical protein FPJ82_20205 [Mycobacterium tuberculosis]|nr:peptide ABC transporter substrate-binding protein [Mycobacterium tuberculosis T17]KAB7801801.1 hypothetical protein F9906_05520 [Mycobacterium tuberculosis]KAB7805981.1 hypothetical protein F9908_04655 [Mycobacterium tuberculosis]KAB7807198.1 hypothetical protein F9907_04920 [Mycobacterium tuberculosis]KAB7814796.1 hypothetical protein F9911_12820 [Mycobacterium tuberculosis]